MADASPVTSSRLIGSLWLRFGYGFWKTSPMQRGRYAGSVSRFGYRIGDTVGGMVSYTVGSNTFRLERQKVE